mgnify:CR=1 FL=1
MIDLTVRKKMTNAAVTKTEQKFSKAQIMASERYVNRRDLVDALLDEKEVYTMKAVDDAIEKYMKGMVK